MTTTQAAELLTKFPSLSSASPDTNPQEETLQIQVKIEPGTLNDTTQGIAGVGVAKTTSNVDLPQHSTKAVEGAYTQQNSTKNMHLTRLCHIIHRRLVSRFLTRHHHKTS